MGCVNFYKSEWNEIKASAALFTGFLLGNLGKKERHTISKEHVCGELVRLLKDPCEDVRSSAAEAMSMLAKYYSVVLLGAIGLSGIVGILDYVLLPALVIFLAITGYALWKRKLTASN